MLDELRGDPALILRILPSSPSLSTQKRLRPKLMSSKNTPAAFSRAELSSLSSEREKLPENTKETFQNLKRTVVKSPKQKRNHIWNMSAYMASVPHKRQALNLTGYKRSMARLHSPLKFEAKPPSVGSRDFPKAPRSVRPENYYRAKRKLEKKDWSDLSDLLSTPSPSHRNLEDPITPRSMRFSPK